MKRNKGILSLPLGITELYIFPMESVLNFRDQLKTINQRNRDPKTEFGKLIFKIAIPSPNERFVQHNFPIPSQFSKYH